MSLNSKIKNKNATTCVIGLGYVGLPLLVEFAKKGFNAIGVDLDEEKVGAINSGYSYIDDVKAKEMNSALRRNKLYATSDYSILKKADTINICVPTPLRKTKDPDISYIIAATKEIARHLRKGQLIILESTTYPGTTEEVVLPILESTGLVVGKDFYLAFSPERVDPGNKQFGTKTIPKVVGGMTEECTKRAVALYKQIISKVFPVSSTRVAEMTKLLENTFRAVNIGLINEIAKMSNKMGIDVWEVIDAAATKPFGFMPFYPGPGLGGHCIPLDPLYLSWKAKLTGFNPRFIELANEINSSMPEYVVSRVGAALNAKKKSINGSKVLILGVAYKRDVNDVRESPALDVIRLLKNQGAEVLYNDPHVPRLCFNEQSLKSQRLTSKLLSSVDCVVIITNHTCYNYRQVVKNAKLLIDTRNATCGLTAGDNLVRV